MRNFKWPSVQKVQCPILNGTLNTFLCSSSTEICVFKLIETRLLVSCKFKCALCWLIYTVWTLHGGSLGITLMVDLVWNLRLPDNKQIKKLVFSFSRVRVFISMSLQTDKIRLQRYWDTKIRFCGEESVSW